MTDAINENIAKYFPGSGVAAGFSETLVRLEAALSRIHQWPLRLGSENRWTVYRNRLKAFAESDESTAYRVELERLAFELREIDELCQIVEMIPEDPNSAELEAVHAILRGTRHPDDERNSYPRDIQYELWLMACLRRHGIKAWLDEPDLWFSWNGSDYPVAAKRPRSWPGVDQSIRGAIRQLRRHNFWGLIALSMDVIARPKKQMLAAESLTEAAELTHLIFMELLEELISVRSPVSKRMPETQAGLLMITLRMPTFCWSGIASLETRIEFLSAKDDNRSSELGGIRALIGSYS
jgi:hypothetical protein